MTGEINYSRLSVGDMVQDSGREPMLAEHLDDIEWYIFKTKPQAELASIVWLERNGIADAWCPTETRWRNIPRGKVKRKSYDAPIAPGYVFVPFTRRPIWHALFERANGKLSRVVSSDGIPLVIPERSIAQMKHVPERIAAIKAREEQARRLNPGDKADVLDGAMKDWTIDVSRIHAGIAYFVAPLLGEREIGISVDRLRKVQY